MQDVPPPPPQPPPGLATAGTGRERLMSLRTLLGALQGCDRVCPDSITGPFQLNAGASDEEVPVVCFQFRMSHFTCKAYLAHGTQDEGSQHLKLQTTFEDNRRSLGEELRYFVANEWNATKRYTRLKCGSGGAAPTSVFTLEYDVLVPAETPHSWGLVLLAQTLRMWYPSMVACVMHIVEPRDVPFATHQMITANTLSGAVREEDTGLLNQCCPICFESFQVGEKVRRLPCMHIFHVVGADSDPSQGRHCNIDRHLVRDKHCPICKTPIDFMERMDRAAVKGSEAAALPIGEDGIGESSGETHAQAATVVASAVQGNASMAAAATSHEEAAASAVAAASAAIASAAVAAEAAGEGTSSAVPSPVATVEASPAAAGAATPIAGAVNAVAAAGATVAAAVSAMAAAGQQTGLAPARGGTVQNAAQQAGLVLTRGLGTEAAELERAVRSLQSRWMQIQDVVAGMQQMLQYIEESQTMMTAARAEQQQAAPQVENSGNNSTPEAVEAPPNYEEPQYIDNDAALAAEAAQAAEPTAAAAVAGQPPPEPTTAAEPEAAEPAGQPPPEPAAAAAVGTATAAAVAAPQPAAAEQLGQEASVAAEAPPQPRAAEAETQAAADVTASAAAPATEESVRGAPAAALLSQAVPKALGRSLQSSSGVPVQQRESSSRTPSTTDGPPPAEPAANAPRALPALPPPSVAAAARNWQPFTDAEKVTMAFLWRWRCANLTASGGRPAAGSQSVPAVGESAAQLPSAAGDAAGNSAPS